MRFAKLFSILALGSFVLGGCANWIPPEARMRMNAERSTYDLCDRLAIGTRASKDVRSEWEMELGRRDASCNTYADERQTQDAVERAAWNRAITSLGRSMAAHAGNDDEPMDSKPAIRGSGMTCFKQGEALRNTSRHCIYSCAGSEVIQTISVAEVCPLSLTR